MNFAQGSFASRQNRYVRVQFQLHDLSGFEKTVLVFACGAQQQAGVQRITIIEQSMRREMKDLVPACNGFDSFFLSRLAREYRAVSGSVDLSERSYQSLLLRQWRMLSIARGSEVRVS